MRTFYEPRVYLVSRPSLDWAAVAQMLTDEYGLDGTHGWRTGKSDTLSESLCELMGRLCYGSFGEKQGRIGAGEYLGNVMDKAHGSILEHANWSFIVCRASRGYMAQQIRHRAGWAYSVESTHFVRFDDDATVCLTGLPEDPLLREMAEEGAASALVKYSELASRLKGKKKQVCGMARSLLPECLQSRVGMTANARALRWFIELRGKEENVIEIRYVAAQVCELLRKEAPSLFSDCMVGTGIDGFPIVNILRSKI